MTWCEQVTQAELHRQFHALGAGVIEDVRVTKDKGFGFVRYRSHEEAAYAIQAANGRVMCGKSVKVSCKASVLTSACGSFVSRSYTSSHFRVLLYDTFLYLMILC